MGYPNSISQVVADLARYVPHPRQTDHQHRPCHPPALLYQSNVSETIVARFLFVTYKPKILCPGLHNYKFHCATLCMFLTGDFACVCAPWYITACDSSEGMCADRPYIILSGSLGEDRD